MDLCSASEIARKPGVALAMRRLDREPGSFRSWSVAPVRTIWDEKRSTLGSGATLPCSMVHPVVLASKRSVSSTGVFDLLGNLPLVVVEDTGRLVARLDPVQGLGGGIDLIIVLGRRERCHLVQIRVEPLSRGWQEYETVLDHAGLGM